LIFTGIYIKTNCGLLRW